MVRQQRMFQADVNYATHANHDRVAVNEAIFIEYLKVNHPTNWTE